MLNITFKLKRIGEKTVMFKLYLLILEVQMIVGATGKLWQFEHLGTNGF